MQPDVLDNHRAVQIQISANPSDNLLLHRYLSGFSACCTPFVERESLVLRKIKKLSGNNPNKSPYVSIAALG